MRARTLTAALAAGALLAGCGTYEPPPAAEGFPEPHHAGEEHGADVEVDDGDPSVLEGVTLSESGDLALEIPDGYAVDESGVRVVAEGEGPVVDEGTVVALDIVAQAADGEEPFYESSATGAPLTVQVGAAEAIPGLSDRLLGRHLGDRLLVALAPEDAWGAEGYAQAGVGPDATVVLGLQLIDVEAPEATGDLDDVTVEGEQGAEPTVELDEQPLYVDETEVEVLDEGDGAEIEAGDTVTADYVAVNGRTGRAFDSTWTLGQPAEFQLDAEGGLLPGLRTALEGQAYGSRVVAAIPSADGFGAAGNPQAQIRDSDTIVFVLDIADEPVEPEASGDISDVTVEGDELGETPTVEFETPLTVAETESEVLIEGDGAEIAQGDSVQVRYVGLNGRTGDEFDGNFGGGAPATFQIADGALIAGFVEGLVGRRVGDRVLITIPSEDGYGSSGQGPDIQGGDTLVFVVDVIAEAGQ